jgi:hypothetical protein
VARFGGRRVASRGLELALAETVATAGDVMRGEVLGAAGRVSVALLRVEVSPSGTFMFAVSACETEPGDRTAFELATPRDLPPPAAGRRCRLEYAVRAVASKPRRARGQVAVPVEICGGRRSVHHDGGYRLDRVIPSHAGRHFHLELADADLQGGGHVTGRVHFDVEGEGGDVSVTARCEEAWCTNFRLRSRRFPPLWTTQQLWQEALMIEPEGDRHWHPFRFDFPPGLPLAVEGRAIAWRYTIQARRPVHLGFSDHAILTPLRFDVLPQTGRPPA